MPRSLKRTSTPRLSIFGVNPAEPDANGPRLAALSPIESAGRG